MTTTAVRWPDRLRGAIQTTKRRNRSAGFRQSDPASGAPYFESWSDDIPTVWDFNLRFGGGDANFFWDWFKSIEFCDYGRAWFIFPIRDEYGTKEVEAHFTASGVPNPTSEAGSVYTYACQILVREIPYDTDGGFRVGYSNKYGDSPEQANALDRAVNIEWPGNS